jgi:hypothetical protein
MNENVGATHLGLTQSFYGKVSEPDRVLLCPGGSPLLPFSENSVMSAPEKVDGNFGGEVECGPS